MVSSEPLFPAGSVTTAPMESVPHSTTIDVADVAWATDPLPEVPSKEAIEALLGKPYMPWHMDPGLATFPATGSVEACSHSHGRLVADASFHPVIAAIHLAFDDHRPLVLSPDMLWLMVAQGFANHVNANAEELRHKFVEHTGKVEIKVRRDEFRKGSPHNPWPGVFGEFSSRIRKHIGAATHDLLMPTFSTTGPLERAAAEITLLDAMQSYFEYTMCTVCGIPQIVLEGTPDDWEMLAERTRGLSQFGLAWWTEILAPILAEFVAASQGRATTQFWRSIYKVDHGSGGPYINGWINAFFPYLRESRTCQGFQKNEVLVAGGSRLQEVLDPPTKSDFRRRSAHGPTTERFPLGLARAPFKWLYFCDEFQMEFLGGFVGVRQDAETLRLRPEIGWAVREEPKSRRVGLD